MSEHTDSDAPSRPRFGVGKSILYSFIIVAAILIMMEVSIRIWAYYFRDQYEKYDLSSQTFKLIPGEHRVGSTTIKINSDGFIGPELKPAGPDLLRIFALGDSCTFGDGDSDTYSALLQQRLEGRGDLVRRYEVVNGGVEGLNSEMALRRLESKGPTLQPSIVTIYIGWNDLMKFDPLAQQNTKRWSTLARLLDELWLTKALRKLVFFYLRPTLAPPTVGAESQTGRFKDFRPAFFEDNLRKLIDTVRRLPAQPVLFTLPTVLREDMSLQDLRSANVVFPYYASAYGVGDLLDLLAGYNRSIRRVATDEHVPLVDLAKIFSELNPPQAYFYDTMHPNRKGRELIADTLYIRLLQWRLLDSKLPSG